MKRGTASRVILGKNTIAEMPGGVFVGTDVILGKKDGLTNDFNGLVLSNTVMFGKKVSHAAIISVIVRGANRIVLPDAIANSLQYVKAFGGTEQLPETYLDTVTLDGWCEQDGTPTPTVPVDIVSNNGVLKYSANMANVNAQTALVGYYISAQGSVLESVQNWVYQDFIPVEPNTTYTLTMSSPVYFVSISEYAVASDGGFIVRDASGSGSHTTFTITTGANTHFVRFGANIDGSSSATLERVLAINWMLNKGNSMPYQPYRGGIYTDGTQEVVTDSVGNTASAEMLLKVGDYKDTQEVISGTVTRNIGVKVFDGTELITASSDNSYFSYTAENKASGLIASVPLPISTHFQTAPSTGTGNIPDNGIGASSTTSNKSVWFKMSAAQDATAFKAFLADQYAAGTPVIVIYPLETPTTESVPGQFLSKSPVAQTAGSISDLPVSTTESIHTTPTPTQLLQINTNNGVLKLSPNLFNGVTVEGYINDSGVEAGSLIAIRTVNYIPVKPNTDYVFSSSGTPTTSTRVHCYDINQTWISMLYKSATNTATITTPANAYYLRCSYTKEFTNVQLEKGSTATSYMPYGQVYTDGTVETINVHSKNLFDKDSIERGKRLDDSGNIVNEANGFVSAKIYVAPNTTYTWQQATASGIYLRICEYNSGGFVKLNKGNTFGAQTLTFTTDANTSYVLVSSHGANLNEDQLELGSAATTYTPYYDGGTATAEMLLKVGNYQDVQSILDGVVTRNVGVKVLDGTEDWTYSSSRFRLNIQGYLVGSSIMATIISHYKLPAINVGSIANGEARFGKLTSADTVSDSNMFIVHDDNYTDLNSYKAWLADQYAAGTPVIVIYPLATATTESVTGQTLQVADGDNVLEITQASMDNLELEAQYNTLVQLTVQEVESANLDNDVTVTIQ